MARWPFRDRTVWIVPLVLLVIVLFEDIVAYKLKQHIANVYYRALLMLVLNAFAFGFAADWLSPHLRRLFVSARKTSGRTIGTVGLLAFYALAYGGLFFAYVIVEKSGPGGLLPTGWR